MGGGRMNIVYKKDKKLVYPPSQYESGIQHGACPYWQQATSVQDITLFQVFTSGTVYPK